MEHASLLDIFPVLYFQHIVSSEELNFSTLYDV